MVTSMRSRLSCRSVAVLLLALAGSGCDGDNGAAPAGVRQCERDGFEHGDQHVSADESPSGQQARHNGEAEKGESEHSAEFPPLGEEPGRPEIARSDANTEQDDQRIDWNVRHEAPPGELPAEPDGDEDERDDAVRREEECHHAQRGGCLAGEQRMIRRLCLP